MELSNLSNQKKVVIMGAGPAGLTAAYKLSQAGIQSVVLEKDNIVGGLSRTVDYKGFKFDIGGHRFFTKIKEVEDIWKEVLGDDFLRRDRLSRIYYSNKFFFYPFKATNALFGLGIINSILILLSYIRSQIFPVKPEITFEDWISNRFGYRLYKVFFRTYTEKVWGVPCNEISAEWASQRIKGLSLLSALKNALLSRNEGSEGVIKTLINSFYYPVHGPGMMWEKMTEIIESGNSEVNLNSEVTRISWSGNKVTSVSIGLNNSELTITGSDFISTMPVRELIEKLNPKPPYEILEAANSLKYRDFITVALIIDKQEIFRDNWIYIHDPAVKVGRIQNFKNWSPYMVPDDNKTCLGLEYFCFEKDNFWNMNEQDLIELAKREVIILGFADFDEIDDGKVVKMLKAYPVYDTEYKNALEKIRNFLSSIENLQLVGRNGMHKYNNQDHSMLTAMLAVRNIMGAKLDVWSVNTDQDYLEDGNTSHSPEKKMYSELASTQPEVPSYVTTTYSYVDRAIIKAFSRLDKFAFASSVGITSAVIIFFMTIWLIFEGGDNIGATLMLLNNYFIGYEISIKGAIIGAAYSLIFGFIFGWLFAYLRNLCLGFIVYNVKKKLERQSLKNLLDYI